jgi:hypothetical protein
MIIQNNEKKQFLSISLILTSIKLINLKEMSSLLDCKWEIMYDLYGNKVSTIDPQGYRDKK